MEGHSSLPRNCQLPSSDKLTFSSWWRRCVIKGPTHHPNQPLALQYTLIIEGFRMWMIPSTHVPIGARPSSTPPLLPISDVTRGNIIYIHEWPRLDQCLPATWLRTTCPTTTDFYARFARKLCNYNFQFGFFFVVLCFLVEKFCSCYFNWKESGVCWSH